MKSLKSLLWRIEAAWNVIRADEFVVSTKKHCLTYDCVLCGCELVDHVNELIKEEEE